jgi:hypothetical protein
LSRLPSSRGSSAAAGGSSRSAPAARRPGVLVQSPKSDIYVALLGVALGAIVVGCLLMAILFGRYGFSTKVSAAPSPAQHSAIA